MIDTATLVSAVRSSMGASAEIIRRALIGEFDVLADFKLVCEYRDVALRPQHLKASARSPESVQSIVDAIESVAIPVSVDLIYRPLSQDPNDDMVLDVAINGRADAIVTNNVKHFAMAAARFGVAVLIPGQFLTALKREGTPHADK